MAVERVIARHLRAVSGAGCDPDRAPVGAVARGCATFYEVRPVGVEYQVRTARITDIDRLVALSAASARPTRDDGPTDPVSLLRQLVCLPQASIFVGERAVAAVGATA